LSSPGLLNGLTEIKMLAKKKSYLNSCLFLYTLIN
jgi:hypothetical protein